MEQRLMILGSMDEFIELVNKAKKRADTINKKE